MFTKWECQLHRIMCPRSTQPGNKRPSAYRGRAGMASSNQNTRGVLFGEERRDCAHYSAVWTTENANNMLPPANASIKSRLGTPRDGNSLHTQIRNDSQWCWQYLINYSISQDLVSALQYRFQRNTSHPLWGS